MIGKSRRTFLIAGLGLLPALSACGTYQPLYGGSSGGDVESKLAAVSIEEEQSRLGQLVRNELISTMSASGGSYTLRLDVKDNTSTVITYPGPRTRRNAAVVVSKYSLFGEDKRKALTDGRVRSSVSYDLTRDQQPIADRQARADAEHRAAVEIATEIRTRLAIYFSRHT